jgi:hypothetical protein
MTELGSVVDIREDQVIKDDRTFLVTDRFGNVPEGNTAALGLYHRDTRFLSGLDLVVDGLEPNLEVAPESLEVTTGEDTSVTASWSYLESGTRYLGLLEYSDGSEPLARTVLNVES